MRDVTLIALAVIGLMLGRWAPAWLAWTLALLVLADLSVLFFAFVLNHLHPRQETP